MRNVPLALDTRLHHVRRIRLGTLHSGIRHGSHESDVFDALHMASMRISIPWFNREKVASSAPMIPFPEQKKRVKIVVIDDDPNSFPTSLLQEDGYTIDAWTSLSAARLHRLESGDYDIIILDIGGITDSSLSDTGDGLGVITRLKAVNRYQVVVAFSGAAFDLGKVPFWKLADDALQKPVSIIKAKETLDALIREHVNVPQYWKSIEALLRSNGVDDSRIRRLEIRVLEAARSKQALGIEDVRKIVGAVSSLGTVASLLTKLLSLWQYFG
jgi:DNA-binding response OmpR family regulator